MRVPIGWLRDYVTLPEDTDEIVARLAALGFPVDEVIERPKLTNVVAGRIAKIEPHPNADRLLLCTIDTAESQQLLIATAATNVAEGQIVPVARIGAQLAGAALAWLLIRTLFPAARNRSEGVVVPHQVSGELST